MRDSTEHFVSTETAGIDAAITGSAILEAVCAYALQDGTVLTALSILKAKKYQTSFGRAQNKSFQ